MRTYGDVAVRATELFRNTVRASPREAWDAAAGEAFPTSASRQRKACPRGAFLGLCEEGLVVGVPAGSYARGRANKSYALQALRLLEREPALADVGPRALWRRVMNGRHMAPNSQMEVVLELWARRLIATSRVA
jgi:hypothetical protein